jgi:hypothetical protein
VSTLPEHEGLEADQRDLPPGLHLKMLAGSAVLLAAAAVVAMKYFL